ncbi:hypothetical protein AALP_AA1G302300 [Arabis alpina]|uniref:Uncharacterized protein n=1 Tax=Arabis alpina TaxID=50452 RepID=A0A087HRM9_ARAAL|nr:hypothetical protein AALP_AA1G302300 [Arabis alpina]
MIHTSANQKNSVDSKTNALPSDLFLYFVQVLNLLVLLVICNL